MEKKEGKPSEDGTPVSPATEVPETVGGGASAEEEATGPAERTITEGPPDGAGKQERAPAEGSISAEFQGESKGEAELQKEDRGKQETTVAPQEMAERKEETNSEPKEAEGKEETTLASENQKADEKEAKPGSREKAKVSDEAQAAGEQEDKAGGREAAGKEEAKAGGREADGKEEAMAGGREAAGKEEAKAGASEAAGKEEATVAPQKESDKTEEPKAEAQEKASAPETKSDSQKKTAVEDEAKPEPQEEVVKEEVKEEVVSEKEERREEAPQRSGVPCPPRPQASPSPALVLWDNPVFYPLISRAWGGGCSTVAPGCLPDLSEALQSLRQVRAHTAHVRSRSQAGLTKSRTRVWRKSQRKGQECSPAPPRNGPRAPRRRAAASAPVSESPGAHGRCRGPPEGA